MEAEVFKVFILEDQKTDQELVKRQVGKYNGSSTFIIADDRKSFYEKIEWNQPDLILADYGLPDFNGLEALLYAKEKMPHIPFVFVTGTLNSEEKAADAILKGADGYVLKENLRSLPEKLKEIVGRSVERNAIEKELAEARRKSKLLFQKLEAKINNMKEADEKSELLSILLEMQRLHG